MSRKADNCLLHKAKANKKDEFYTQLEDIDKELKYYKEHFANKVVYCNCDDIKKSNFVNYFISNFNQLKLKKLICSCYVESKYNLLNLDAYGNNGYYFEYTGINNTDSYRDTLKLKGDGDFRSQECINILKKADIIVTNPPFSLFREYIDQLIKYNKKFLIIGNINSITYKNVFNLIQNNKAWLGINLGRGISGFIVPEDYELYGKETKIDQHGRHIISPNNCLWLTNLDNKIRHERITLTKRYKGHEDFYPHFDNYNAINVNKTSDIPVDFDGIMGVPITFLHKFNPDQFKIIKFRKGDDDKDLTIKGKPTYFRILIKYNKIAPDR